MFYLSESILLCNSMEVYSEITLQIKQRIEFALQKKLKGKKRFGNTLF